jgi:hypothetical protein
MTDQFPLQPKHIATVRDVARMVSLSPARFYQLQQAGIFPMPLYDIITRRPHYTMEQQDQCLQVRRTNCGINGKPILFYARRIGIPMPTKRRKIENKSAGMNSHAELIEGLKSLGMTAVTSSSVDSAVKELFPNGTTSVGTGEIIKQVFVHLRRQNTGDNVGR